mmetsp:Transcript_91557/g.209835  ORF Transcript_91557/g.209835 Transcript_91557/m.209835 type:complete len:212 (+) Transcript_91557:1152-1787(+)
MQWFLDQTTHRPCVPGTASRSRRPDPSQSARAGARNCRPPPPLVPAAATWPGQSRALGQRGPLLSCTEQRRHRILPEMPIGLLRQSQSLLRAGLLLGRVHAPPYSPQVHTLQPSNSGPCPFQGRLQLGPTMPPGDVGRRRCGARRHSPGRLLVALGCCPGGAQRCRAVAALANQLAQACGRGAVPGQAKQTENGAGYQTHDGLGPHGERYK